MTNGPPCGNGGPDGQEIGLKAIGSVYPAPSEHASCSILRPHQLRLIADIDRALANGCRRIVCQAPTGFGKTIVGAALAKRSCAAGERVIFTVPALSLIDQTVEKFYVEKIHDLGVIQADHVMTNYARKVQIASVLTLSRRGMPAADLVMIDEVHRWFDPYGRWLSNEWRGVPVIGLSATPWTKGLGRFFDQLIVGATTQELIEDGYLSRFRVFAPASPDLSNVRTLAGDYHEGDLSQAMDRAPLVADVVGTWHDRAQGRPTLCFAVDRAHAKHLQEKFTAAGVPAAYIDCHTKAAQRHQIAGQFHAGSTKVVCNVGCLTTGIDWDVRCIIMARPTRSEMLFVQMIGRGLRVARGKTDCLILDHSDNHLRLGFVTDIHHEHLDDGREREQRKPKPPETLPKKCPKCAFLKPPKVLACPCCGFIPVPTCTVTNRDGELVEMIDRTTVAPIDPVTFYRELKHYAAEHGYKPGWVAHQFRKKLDRWPNGLEHVSPIPPSRTTLGWIKSQQIAWAKSQPRRAV
jgi:DNA repair protein RadD